MIVTTKKGRKRSILTPDEIAARAGELISTLTDEEQALFFRMLNDEPDELMSVEETMIEHRYHTRPVSMEQFIDDPYYLGESCTTLYPELKKDLIDLFEHPYREVVLCLHPDTIVPLLDGAAAPMSDLIRRWDKTADPIGVYSIDSGGNVVAGHGEQIRYTGEDDYYRVTLDNGAFFTCNARHQMVMRNGIKKMARDMIPGDSIMPFETKISSRGSGRRCVISVEKVGHGPVCCMTVPGYENFAILTRDEDGKFDRGNGVYSSNTGAIGVGKTFLLSIAILRVIYELSCLVDPQRTFGLSSGTEMVIPLISKNLILAREVMKTAVDDKIRESMYFMEKFAPKFSKDNTIFPNNVRVVIGSYGSERILGSNVFSVGLDECLRKFSLICVENGGGGCELTVGDLLEMGPEERANCEVVGLDHDNRRVSSGWWRIKESTVQKMVSIGTDTGKICPSRNHPVLVRRGDWCVYEKAENVCPGDFVVRRMTDATKRTDVKRGGEEDALKCAGVRPEKIRVNDLPPELFLEEVRSVELLGSEQTYSLCTEYGTFIADGFVVHNTNFPPTRKAQQITTAIGQRKTVAHFDPVEKVYRSLLRRIKSRFQKAGGDFPGMVILASSAATLESFTERKMQESMDDPQVFVRDHTPWTAKPETEFCGEKFWVLCSTSSIRARILDESEYDDITDDYLADNDAWLLDIPIEYLTDFETDLENALRDIAGISTQAISSFIQRPEAVDNCADPSVDHAFSMGEWTAGGPGRFKWDTLCRSFERRLPGGFVETGFAPVINPKKLRWCHVDTSISGDCTGFAVGHIDRWVEVVRRDGAGGRFTDLAPFYHMDVILRINPPPGEQIYLPDIRRLVYEMQAHGYAFMGFSTDKYQYVEMHQQVKRRGIHTELISMDEKTDPYDELKRAIYEDRIRYHKYEPFIEELKHLEYDRLRGKIDHPRAGCFVGETRVPLLSGECPMISELNGKEIWVYSCAEDGRVVPGRARGRATKMVTELVDVVLDSGAVERCTPEHPWMLRDGTYKRADELRPGVDRLMPANRVWPVNGGYERVTDSSGRRVLTHHKVRHVIPVKLDEPVWVYDLEVDCWSNFLLSSGAFVHNSKDSSDAVAGVVYGLLQGSARLPIGLETDTQRKGNHEHAWVSRMIPASKIDAEEAKAMAEEELDESDYLPIIFD